MELFLIRAKVRWRRYMRDHDDEMEDFRLVRAANEAEAEEKYKEFWYAKDSPYDISYYVDVISVAGVIE